MGSQPSRYPIVGGGEAPAPSGTYVPLSVVDAAGDLIIGSGPDAVARLAKGAALDVLRVNAGATGLEFAAPAAGGVSWQQVLTDDCSSLAPWTVVAGTWAADAGGFFKQTSTVTGNTRLRKTANVGATFGAIVEADVRLPSVGQVAGDLFASISLLDEGSSAGGPNFRLQRIGGVWQSSMLSHATAARSTRTLSGVTGALDTWFRLRMVVMGDAASGYVNGVYQTTAGIQNANAIDFVHLAGDACLADYDNVKVYALTGGLPA